jgi:hypothetical protein
VSGSTEGRGKGSTRAISPDALLCALVLAPNTFARNRFFGLFEDPALRRVRRRAYHVRGILRQLLGSGNERALVTGRLELDDTRVLLRYRVENVKVERTTALSALEFALLNYALHRAGHGDVEEEERALVENALRSLGGDALERLG